MSLLKALGLNRAADEQKTAAAAQHDQLTLASNRIERVPAATPPRRELRSQAFQRLQVGLLGLTATLMMVGLANIIMDRALEAEREITATQPASPSPSATPPDAKAAASEPLSDIGVVPDLPPASGASPSPSPAH